MKTTEPKDTMEAQVRESSLDLTPAEFETYNKIIMPIRYVDHASFADARTEATLFGEDLPRIEVPAWTQVPVADQDDDNPSKAPKRRTLKAADEVRLFLQYNYARYRLAKLAKTQARRRSTARAHQMIMWYRRSTEALENITRANMALVVSMASRSHVANEDVNELISEGNMALLRSAEKFDVSRGFKFSTYACRSIIKSFNRLASKSGRYHQRFPAEFNPDMEPSNVEEHLHEYQWNSTLDDLHEILEKNRAELSDLERKVITERYATVTDGKKRTLAQVGKMIGLTNERVRQIQKRALVKIRTVLFETYLSN